MNTMLAACVVGVALALGIVAFVRLIGFARRTFYATLALVNLTYYLLFAAISGVPRTLVVEGIIALAFLALVVFGFKRHTYAIVAALALHAVLDASHGFVVTSPATPTWWPAFCLTFDLTAAAALAWELERHPVPQLVTAHGPLQQ